VYAKFFSSVIFSSLWHEHPNTRVLFLTLMAMADKEGYIYASRPGLARAAALEEGTCNAALDILIAPDVESSDITRNPENEGRRVEEIPGGWRVINYSYYRELGNQQDRRDSNRLAQRRRRAKMTDDDVDDSQIEDDKSTESDKSASEASPSSSPEAVRTPYSPPGRGTSRRLTKGEAEARIGRHEGPETPTPKHDHPVTQDQAARAAGYSLDE
jgi:hypothetical protein